MKDSQFKVSNVFFQTFKNQKLQLMKKKKKNRIFIVIISNPKVNYVNLKNEAYKRNTIWT